ALTGTTAQQVRADRAVLQDDPADFPAVDPQYIYDQLNSMVTRYQGREAGYDSASATGHRGFADYWSQEMLNHLRDFGASASRYEFPVKGWADRPATSPAYNVEVSVPGATHPEQVVIIGCHYDGEAVSTQSAYDDASGCAIELGVARALAVYWHQHQLYPSRTIRFVIFDAEEQGLYGSFDYVNNTVNGDLSNIVAMINEEQNGIAYPLRYLGQMKYPLMPLEVWTSPLENNRAYPDLKPLSPDQKARIQRFNNLLRQGLPIVFQRLRELGYAGLTYHGDKQDVAQPIFTAGHQQYVHFVEDDKGSSDQMPFTFAGLPCATFAGNTTYYERNAPPGSYPYDQRTDTLQLMNTFANGSSRQSKALTLALALPAMFTAWVLHQPDVAGTTAASTISAGQPLAAIGSIGPLRPGKSVTFDAKAAFDPHNRGTKLKYSWDFGDGSRGSGVSVRHTYSAPGSYTLALTVDTGSGQAIVSKKLSVEAEPPSYPNPYAAFTASGSPRPNPSVILPTPNDALSDKVLNASELSSATAPSPSLVWLISGVVLLAVALGAVCTHLLLRRRRGRGPTREDPTVP
ncbi:MAG: M28 family peptidase, partial [Ktedonobacteraceae bacterium]|nr:M28 family peptidase [Ktedonobacteraceae bacterium]